MQPQYLDDLSALNEDGSDYIRLLRVHNTSSKPNDVVLFELRVFSLQHAPRYAVLSYFRQPEYSIVNIDVQRPVNGSFSISHGLRSATWAVQHHRQNDWLLIDALCINQASKDEKNDQVPRMREIYENAYAGFVWLVVRRQHLQVTTRVFCNCT